MGIGAFAFNNVVLDRTETVEQTDIPQQDLAKTQTLRQGSFINADNIHSGQGRVSVLKTPEGKQALKFDGDFKVTNGPDLVVQLSKNGNIEQDKKSGEVISLGKLQNTSGEQTYTLPDNADQYPSVIVYCRAFKTPFAVALLK